LWLSSPLPSESLCLTQFDVFLDSPDAFTGNIEELKSVLCASLAIISGETSLSEAEDVFLNRVKKRGSDTLYDTKYRTNSQ